MNYLRRGKMSDYVRPRLSTIQLGIFFQAQGTGSNALALSCEGAPSCLGSDLLGWECTSGSFVDVRFVLPDQQCPASITCEILLNGLPVQCNSPVMLDSDQECDEGCVVLYQLCSQSCTGNETLSVQCEGFQTVNCSLTNSNLSS